MAKRTFRKTPAQDNKKTLKPKTNDDTKPPVWIFTQIDRNGDFAFDTKRADFKHADFLEKMISYSNMTWNEIKTQTHDKGKSKNHMLSPGSLSKAAYDRLKALDLEEHSDALFSFAFDNVLRIIGIRDGRCFNVLWYDAKHEVCPSKK